MKLGVNSTVSVMRLAFGALNESCDASSSWCDVTSFGAAQYVGTQSVPSAYEQSEPVIWARAAVERRTRPVRRKVREDESIDVGRYGVAEDWHAGKEERASSV